MEQLVTYDACAEVVVWTPLLALRREIPGSTILGFCIPFYWLWLTFYFGEVIDTSFVIL